MRNLSRLPEKQSATKLVREAVRLDRGGCHTFQAGLDPMERRQQQERQRTSARERIAERWTASHVIELSRRVVERAREMLAERVARKQRPRESQRQRIGLGL